MQVGYTCRCSRLHQRASVPEIAGWAVQGRDPTWVRCLRSRGCRCRPCLTYSAVPQRMKIALFVNEIQIPPLVRMLELDFVCHPSRVTLSYVPLQRDLNRPPNYILEYELRHVYPSTLTKPVIPHGYTAMYNMVTDWPSSSSARNKAGPLPRSLRILGGCLIPTSNS